MNADLILTKGKIITLDESNSIVDTVVIKDGKILYAGQETLIDELAGAETEIVDLSGRAVLPGMIDSHMHPGIYGVYKLHWVECGPDLPSIDHLLKRIMKKAHSTPAGNWILGHSLDNVVLGRYPSMEELDMVTPHHPLFIERRDGHMGVVNSLALQAAGITVETPDPPHGVIQRDAAGDLTGILQESAMDLVMSCVPQATVEEYTAGLKAVNDEFLSLGLTTIHASMTGSAEFRAFQNLKADGQLKLRVCVHAAGSEEGFLEALVAAGIQTPFGDDWLKLTEIEWILDTSTSGRTAAYYEPYVDEAENVGMLLYAQEDINSRVRKAHQAGLRVGLDGIGDRGIDAALDAIQAALEESPGKDHRHRIEHCCYVTPAIQDRLLQLGVINASASGFLHDLGDAYLANRGEHEMRWMWPHRTLIDRGIPSPGHSDCPVCSPNPWLGIYGLVTRKSDSGRVLYAGEGITPMEAIRAYTIDGAYAAWEEQIKGTIETGKYADLVVLDRDPRNIPVEELKDVRTTMTIVNGCIAHQD